MFARSRIGYSRATSSIFGASKGILSFFHNSWVLLVNESGAVRKIMSPVLKNRRTFISRPHSSSNLDQRSIASLAHVIQSSAHRPLSPYDERTPRVSSPEVERELPGPYASTKVTDAPSCLR